MNLKKIALLGGVGVASAAAGIAIPQMMSGQSHETKEVKPDPAHATDAGHAKKDKKDKKEPAKPKDHGAAAKGAVDAHGKPVEGEVVHADGPRFVHFERTVTNLNDPSLTRYMALDITLQVEPEDEAETKSAIETRKSILQGWLITHLADKTIEDIRGKVGVNRLRREIQDNFNSLLFSDGRERIREVHFEEFHVQ